MKQTEFSTRPADTFSPDELQTSYFFFFFISGGVWDSPCPWTKWHSMHTFLGTIRQIVPRNCSSCSFVYSLTLANGLQASSCLLPGP